MLTNILLKEREDTLKANYGIITLGNNFRSKQEIVEFNNNYFTYIYEALPLDSYIRDAYIDLKQQWKENNTGGGVRLSMITNKERNYLEALADEVLNCIEEAINDNYQQSDIAILCRSRCSFLSNRENNSRNRLQCDCIRFFVAQSIAYS